jgi:hypothetical protein
MSTTLTTNGVTAYDSVDTATFALSLGTWISKSGLFGCSNIEQGTLLALQCIVERKAPLDLAKLYHIISGKLSLRADAMLGLYRERGGKVRWLQFDAKAASACWIYEGNEVVICYTREDAMMAGMLPAKAGGMWAKYPAEMLRARLISKSVRMLAPEVCAGVYTPEEVEDFKAPANVAPTTLLVPALPSSTVTSVVAIDNVPALSPLAQLEALLKQHSIVAEANLFLLSQKWIEVDISDMQLVRIDKILAKPDAFVTAVKNYIAKLSPPSSNELLVPTV